MTHFCYHCNQGMRPEDASRSKDPAMAGRAFCSTACLCAAKARAPRKLNEAAAEFDRILAAQQQQQQRRMSC